MADESTTTLRRRASKLAPVRVEIGQNFFDTDRRVRCRVRADLAKRIVDAWLRRQLREFRNQI